MAAIFFIIILDFRKFFSDLLHDKNIPSSLLHYIILLSSVPTCICIKPSHDSVL